MKEEIVDFTLAKQLERLGFVEGSRLGYINAELPARNPHYGELYKNTDSENNLNYEAPTLSIAQKWFREKHNVHILIIPCVPHSWEKDLFKKEYGWIFDIEHPILTRYGAKDTVAKETYEAALMQALKEVASIIIKETEN